MHRAFWRWHFYASVLVVPVLAMLAVTGLVYLYRWQIDPLTHPGVLTVPVPAGAEQLPLGTQQAAVQAALPDAVVTAVQQGADGRTTFFTVELGAAGTRNVYVNPYTAQVVGQLTPGTLVSDLAVQVHGQIVTGRLADLPLVDDPVVGEVLTLGGLGDRVIELAACWAVVMALTGYVLFFTGRTARLRRLAAGARRARLTHLHAWGGVLAGAGILLLVVSGLPWTGLWGAKVQQFASGHGLSLWGADPGAESDLGARLDEIGSASAPAPWAEGASALPSSGTPDAAAAPADPDAPADGVAASAAGDGTSTGDDMGGMAGMDHGGPAAAGTADGDVGVDVAVAAALADGLVGPFYVAYPQDDTGVYSVLADQWHDPANPASTDVQLERTVHVDRYTGEVLATYGYADYSAVAKVVSQGIALHEGRRFGTVNTVLTTVFCLTVLFLCVSGPVMWWRRRPRGGGLGAPRGAMPVRSTPWLLAVLVLLGVALPLFGVSLVLVLLFDRLVLARVPRWGRALGRV